MKHFTLFHPKAAVSVPL